MENWCSVDLGTDLSLWSKLSERLIAYVAYRRCGISDFGEIIELFCVLLMLSVLMFCFVCDNRLMYSLFKTSSRC